MRVLVVNAGSSSVKLAVVQSAPEGQRTLVARELPAAGSRAAVAGLGDEVQGAGLTDVDAVAHRIVHGGGRFEAAVRSTPTSASTSRGCVRWPAPATCARCSTARRPATERPSWRLRSTCMC